MSGLAVKCVPAVQVVLTDHEDKVLQNLRDCVASNMQSPRVYGADTASCNRPGGADHKGPAQATSSSTYGAPPNSPGRAVCNSPDDAVLNSLPKVAKSKFHTSAGDNSQEPAAAPARAEPDLASAPEQDDRGVFDPDDADSCDDLDEIFQDSPTTKQTVASQDTKELCWELVSITLLLNHLPHFVPANPPDRQCGSASIAQVSALYLLCEVSVKPCIIICIVGTPVQ